jgi:hypothetical protein
MKNLELRGGPCDGTVVMIPEMAKTAKFEVCGQSTDEPEFRVHLYDEGGVYEGVTPWCRSLDGAMQQALEF